MKGNIHIVPLADRMRPTTLDDFYGQQHIIGKGALLRRLLQDGQFRSCMFWGPPGVGKTTLAHIIARMIHAEFVILSGVMSGKSDLKRVVAAAEERLAEDNTARTLLFIDEIHRWTKAQQDALLPYVERGIITLIGATTENPSFEIIRALLSRSHVFVLNHLSDDDLVSVLRRALKDKEHGLGEIPVDISDDVLLFLAGLASGDARQALNGLELAVSTVSSSAQLPYIVTRSDIKEALQRVHLVFDKQGEEFYNLISALHKSMRGSDPHASLYWLARMLEGGADPLYVARRIVRFASEDIGMANSEALVQAQAVYSACHSLGMPECAVHLAQAVVYCAKSKKSNVLYTAYRAAAEDAVKTSHLGVPLHLRNAPTAFMKELGYGKGYKYNHDYIEPVDQEYLPSELKGKTYF